MKYEDAKKQFRRIVKYDSDEIFYDSKDHMFYHFIKNRLYLAAKNRYPEVDELNLFHYVESTRSFAEKQEKSG